eukprot:6468113-Amphidinium_carterae.2
MLSYCTQYCNHGTGNRIHGNARLRSSEQLNTMMYRDESHLADSSMPALVVRISEINLTVHLSIQSQSLACWCPSSPTCSAVCKSSKNAKSVDPRHQLSFPSFLSLTCHSMSSDANQPKLQEVASNRCAPLTAATVPGNPLHSRGTLR